MRPSLPALMTAAAVLVAGSLTIGPALAGVAPTASTTCTSSSSGGPGSGAPTTSPPSSSAPSHTPTSAPLTAAEARELLGQLRLLVAELNSVIGDARAARLNTSLRDAGITPAVSTGWRQLAHDLADALLADPTNPKAADLATALARAGFSPTPADLRTPPPTSTTTPSTPPNGAAPGAAPGAAASPTTAPTALDPASIVRRITASATHNLTGRVAEVAGGRGPLGAAINRLPRARWTAAPAASPPESPPAAEEGAADGEHPTAGSGRDDNTERHTANSAAAGADRALGDRQSDDRSGDESPGSTATTAAPRPSDTDTDASNSTTLPARGATVSPEPRAPDAGAARNTTGDEHRCDTSSSGSGAAGTRPSGSNPPANDTDSAAAGSAASPAPWSPTSGDTVDSLVETLLDDIAAAPDDPDAAKVASALGEAGITPTHRPETRPAPADGDRPTAGGDGSTSTPRPSNSTGQSSGDTEWEALSHRLAGELGQATTDPDAQKLAAAFADADIIPARPSDATAPKPSGERKPDAATKPPVTATAPSTRPVPKPTDQTGDQVAASSSVSTPSPVPASPVDPGIAAVVEGALAGAKPPVPAATASPANPPAAPLPAAPAAGKSAPSPAVAGPNMEIWNKIAACESGGNWQISTGNGYFGGLQFDPATWKAYGGHEFAPSADKATQQQQITVAERLRAARGGFGSWPSCSKKLGLP